MEALLGSTICKLVFVGSASVVSGLGDSPNDSEKWVGLFVPKQLLYLVDAKHPNFECVGRGPRYLVWQSPTYKFGL